MTPFEKDTAPLERPSPPAGGFFNGRRIGLLVAAVGVVGALAAYGFSLQGEEIEEIKVSDVLPANINVADARPHEFKPQAEGPRPDVSADTSGNGSKSQPLPPSGPPEGFRKISPVVMRGSTSTVGQQVQSVQQGSGSYAANARRGSYPGQEGYDLREGSYGAERRSSKERFYAGGGFTDAGDLDIAGAMLPEAQGCVVKAGTQVTLQTRSRVRTTLPQRVLGYVVNPVEGNHYLGNGQVERCLAIPAMSTVLSEINVSGVERGDLRIQACALRLDLYGGGRRPLGCQPAHGADGGAGIEASTDYAVTGIVTGILVEAALASARGLGGLIAGPPGVAVQVGTGMVSDVGSEYVRRELMRPPVLTMEAGAIYGVQLNGDLSFPID